jgi:hypothetical protein
VIDVLSDRADLISGGEALVAVAVPRGEHASKLRMTLNRHNVSSEFAVRANGSYEGMLTGLRVGANKLVAMLPDHRGARITITDHPIGGPVFAGPQVEPWTCQSGAQDAKCDEPPTIQYLYESTNPALTGLQPYDINNPPSDVATTTTDNGVKVPFIVREETGFEDRDEYRMEVLWQPGKPWQPWAPQTQWDHKVLIPGGFDCITAYQPTTPVWDLTTVPGVEATTQEALGMGFAVVATALDNS